MPNERLLNLCAPVEGWIEAGPPTGDASAPALRRFSMTAYTGGPMMLAGWPHPVVVDLAGLQVAGGGAKSRPILKDHNRSLIVGHTDAVRIEGSQLLVSGVISGAGPVAREIVESSRNGFPWQASLGAMAQPGGMEFIAKGKKAVANGREFEGPVHIARRSVLGEVSFVALGADDNTTASVAAAAIKEDDMTFDQWLAAKGFDSATLSDAQKASLQAMFDNEQKAAAVTAAATGTDPGEGGDTEVPPHVASIRAETAAETTRIAEVRRVCAVGGGKHAEIEAKAIAEGWDVNKTELAVLRADRPALHLGGVRPDAEPAQAGRAIEAALCLSAGIPEETVGKWYDQRTMNAAVSGTLSGAGIHSALAYVIEAAGGSARMRRVDNEFIQTAFEANNLLRQQERQIRAAGGFSTIS
ncbi:MAG: hypothetical protein KF897_17495, partial [Opitutaceae bacterium]|nr:hypothetical protein [Opitutaceae bacterium]